MKERKQFAALLLTVVLGISTFVSGCGKDKPTGTSSGSSSGGEQNSSGQSSSGQSGTEESTDGQKVDTSEHVTIKLMINFDKIGDVAKKWLEQVEKDLNITVEWELPPTSGYEDSLQLMLLNDDRPDAVLLPDTWLKSDVFEKSCQGGVFQDISKLLPQFENIMKHTASASWTALDIFNDGKIWGMPRSTVMRADGFVMNRNWLDNLKIDYKEGDYLTIDEFYDILYKFSHNDPDGNSKNDTYGLRGYKDTDGSFNDGGIRHIFGIGETPTWREYNGKLDCLNYSKDMPNFKQYLEFVSKCWKDGLFDPDSFSIDRATAVEHVKNNKVGAHAEYVANTHMQKNSETDLMDIFTYCPGVVEKKGDKFEYGDYGTGIWWYWGITSNCKYPERVLQFFDTLLSDAQWTNLSVGGLEGYSYSIDKDGNYDFSLMDKIPKEQRSVDPMRYIVRRSDDPEFFVSKLYSKELRQHINDLLQLSFDNYLPALDCGYKPEIASNPTYIDYMSYMQDEIHKIIAGEEPVSHWDEVLDGWYKAGGTEYYEQMTAYIKSREKK